eukprot:scaffold11829_cov95-Isochrysis_galbana.AAC.3
MRQPVPVRTLPLQHSHLTRSGRRPPPQHRIPPRPPCRCRPRCRPRGSLRMPKQNPPHAIHPDQHAGRDAGPGGWARTPGRGYVAGREHWGRCCGHQHGQVAGGGAKGLPGAGGGEGRAHHRRAQRAGVVDLLLKK